MTGLIHRLLMELLLNIKRLMAISAEKITVRLHVNR